MSTTHTGPTNPHAASNARASRVPRGTSAGGQFAATSRNESAASLGVVEERPHELAHLGISTVTLESGIVVARNNTGTGIICPTCSGDRALAAECRECAGRGCILDIPFCDREWDEVGEGLWLGGHDCQDGGGTCLPGDRFDLVVSLYRRAGFEPEPHIPHLHHKMVDGDLHPDDMPAVERLADAVAEALEARQRVLVRCLAGMNRSGLVAGLAQVKRGHSVDSFLAAARSIRSPYVLFNASFVNYLRTREAQIQAA